VLRRLTHDWLTAANVFAACCKAEGLAPSSTVPATTTSERAGRRHPVTPPARRAMGHACDAFYRVSGEIAAINAHMAVALRSAPRRS
jgi:hypothetical protein